MGKKSRAKRAAAPALHPVRAAFRTSDTAMLRQGYEGMLAEHAEQQRRAAWLAENAEIERKNALPLGHPDNRAKMEKTLAPLARLFDAIADTGEVDTLLDGTAVFRTPDDDELWPIAECFAAVCDVYDMAAADIGVPSQTAGLLRFAKKMDVGMMLFESDLLEARASLAWIYEMTERMTPNQFSEYTATHQIKMAFQERGLAAAGPA